MKMKTKRNQNRLMKDEDVEDDDEDVEDDDEDESSEEEYGDIGDETFLEEVK